MRHNRFQQRSIALAGLSDPQGNLNYFLFVMLAVVLATFVVAIALVLATLMVAAASLLTSLHFAAVLSTVVWALFAVLLCASGVLAGALTFVATALVCFFAALGSYGVSGFFSSLVAVASGHTECESSCDHSGQKYLLHN